MGANTIAELQTEAGNLAGRTDISSVHTLGWLNKWLRSQYLAWPWPFLSVRRSGLALVPGTQSILVGGGNSGITNQIAKVKDSFFLRTTDFSHRSKPRLLPSEGLPIDMDPSMQNTTVQRGPPSGIQVRAGNSPAPGVWELIFYPTPDKAYVLAFDYQYIPAAHVSTADVPLYPNDRTMVQALVTEILRFANGTDDSSYQSALEVLAAQTIDDRVKSGQIPGTNDVWGLDGGVFL